MIDNSEIKIIKTRTGVMTWDSESHFLFIELYEGAIETIDDAIANCKLGSEITENKPFVMCLDISKMHSISLEARKYYSKNSSTTNQGIAIITRTPISRVIGNFFIGLNKPKLPVKLFSSKTESIVWLDQFINALIIK